MLGGGVSVSLSERGAGCLAALAQSLWQDILWCLHWLAQTQQHKAPSEPLLLPGPTARVASRAFLGSGFVPAGGAKGHLCLQLTELHPRLFLWAKQWPEETRHQQASVTAVAQAAGTLCAGERQGQMPLSGRPWLCPARQREALSEGSPGTMQIFHQPRREGGQCPPAFKEWCQRKRRRRRQVPV